VTGADGRAFVDRVREYWDADAATYDRTSGHYPATAAEWAAWQGALQQLLPAPPGQVLDVGAGTGFLSIAAARLGHQVTAVDLSQQMLDRLTEKALAEQLPVVAVCAAADDVPLGEFDAVTSRHLLWTLPDPVATLRRWRAAAPRGRLVLVEGVWGQGQSALDRVRSSGRRLARRLSPAPAGHHAEYDPVVAAALPFGRGLSPERLVELVERAGWRNIRLHRLRDVEWMTARQLAGAERWFGTHPLFAVVAY
jgi:SAM-dependent methyltransferase